MLVVGHLVDELVVVGDGESVVVGFVPRHEQRTEGRFLFGVERGSPQPLGVEEIAHATRRTLVEYHRVGRIGYTAHDRLHQVFGFHALRGFVQTHLREMRHQNIVADDVVRLLCRADGDTTAHSFDNKRLVAPLEGGESEVFDHFFFAEQPSRQFCKHFRVHTPYDTSRILDMRHDNGVHRPQNEQLLPRHVQLYERREANLPRFDDYDTHGLAVFVAIVYHPQQFALSSIECKENVLWVERIFVFDVEKRGGAELKVVSAACFDDFLPHQFEIDFGVAQVQAVEIGADGEIAVPQVAEYLFLVAVERHLVVYPAQLDGRERQPLARGAAFARDGVVGVLSFEVTLLVDM